jgi:hypothetical protein
MKEELSILKDKLMNGTATQKIISIKEKVAQYEKRFKEYQE